MAHPNQPVDPVVGPGRPPNISERCQRIVAAIDPNSALPNTLAASLFQSSAHTSLCPDLPPGRTPCIPPPTTHKTHDRWARSAATPSGLLCNLKRQEEQNSKRMDSWLKFVEDRGEYQFTLKLCMVDSPPLPGTYYLDCSVSELDARPDEKEHYTSAYLISMALQDPTISARSESGRWYDKDNRLMVAYFAGAHGMPKTVVERKHWHTQKLFSLQERHGRPQDNRHLNDVDKPLFYYYKEGEAEPYAEYKGLRHDIELRFEQGHKHDVSVQLMFYKLFLIENSVLWYLRRISWDQAPVVERFRPSLISMPMEIWTLCWITCFRLLLPKSTQRRRKHIKLAIG